MKIDLIKLKSGIIDKIEIDEILKVDDELLKENGILELKNVKVSGYINKDSIDEYNLNVKVYGIMVLPCSISLKPTNYEFSFEIDDNIDKLLEEIGIFDKNSENTLDIFPIIWENILMEIPIRIVNDDIHDVKMEGNGWKIITERTSDEEINPELAKLKDLLK